MRRTIAIILILILAPTFIQANTTTSQEEIMVSILDELDGNYIRGDISANQMIYESFYDLDALEGFGQDIKEHFQVKESNRFIQNEKNYCQINYYGYDNNSNEITIILSSYLNEEDKNGGTYLYLNFLNTEQFLPINDIIENVDLLSSRYNSKVEITTNIVGKAKKNIDLGDYGNIIEKAIENKNGKILDKYEDENLISYNGYTKSLKEFIELGNDKINLNIAIRCNKTEDTTLIYIGTPIIIGGY